jgi:hypothetical protein
MKRNLAFLLAGVALGSTSFALASPLNPHRSKIVLRDGDDVVMPDLRWECFYFTDLANVLTGAPPGPVLNCGRLGALTGGIRTSTDLYNVLVRRGTNAAPHILFRNRRP